MAAPSIRLSASNEAGSNSVTVTLPSAPAAGELIVFLAAANDNDSPPVATGTVTGFTQLGAIDGDFNAVRAFGKIAGGSEGTSYTCTFTGGVAAGSVCGVVLVFQDADSSLPSNVTTIHDTSASTTYSIPSLTTTAADSYDLVAISSDGNNASAASRFSSWGSSLTELFDFSATYGGGNWGNLAAAGTTRATAGLQAATTVTSSDNDKNVALRIEIKAAGGGSPSPTLPSARRSLLGVGF